MLSVIPSESVFLLSVFFVLYRLYVVLPRTNSRLTLHRDRSLPCSLAVFLGSGGHTTEALSLISSLDFSRYTPRTYILSDGDSLSAQKAKALEAMKAADGLSATTITDNRYTIITIPRARRVHQPLLTTPPTALYSLLACIYHFTLIPLLYKRSRVASFAEVLIINGPGTCFVLCASVYVNKFLGLPSPKLIYFESFARVRSLSLSGKLLRPLVDRFVVQWPNLLTDGGRGECRGWLV